MIIAVLGAALIAAVIVIVWQWQKARTDSRHLWQRLEQYAHQNGALKHQIQLTEQHHQEKLALVEQSKNKLAEQLEKLAQQQQQQADRQLQFTLSPLQEQLVQFRQRVDLLDKQNTQERASLVGHIRQLHGLNQQLSKDAQLLASALLGSQKQQGDWGELVLARIFEASGLTPEREYSLQASFKQDGRHLRPDAVIYLPQGKQLIVDAKVSLAAWHRFQSSQAETDSKALVQAVRQHIDDLAKKDYSQIESINAPDYVLLFFAIEPALHHALSQDPTLFDYAASKRVLLTSASSLMVNLKTAAALWQLSKQNDNAQHIVQRANKLYDKLRNFVEHLQRVGQQLDNAQSGYQQAMRTLTTGPGNVLQQSEDLLKMGVRPKKMIDHKEVAKSVRNCDTIHE